DKRARGANLSQELVIPMARTSEDQITPEQGQAMIQAALNSPLPRFYANSFMQGATDSDIMTIFQCNGQNIFILNMSYVSAKTLANGLSELLEAYEARNRLIVPTIGRALTIESGITRTSTTRPRRRRQAKDA